LSQAAKHKTPQHFVRGFVVWRVVSPAEKSWLGASIGAGAKKKQDHKDLAKTLFL
jgi:hypothetical protein